MIGNSSYKDAPLKNPVNDATDIAAALRDLGFQVVLRTNANRRQMVEAVREFGSKLKKGGVGLFYFAGHGMQSRGRNFLMPVGAALEAEADLEFETVDANMVLAQMDEAGNRVNIVVLDACRNNPFVRSFRSASRGLAQMDAATGTFLAYATAPGSIAADGEGRNGIFTKHLLSSLKNQESRVEDVFKRVRVQVARETANKQIPWDLSSLTGDFYFRSGTQVASMAPAATAIPVPADPAANDRAFWESVKDSERTDDLKAYLDKFPEGLFATVARTRLQSREATQRVDRLAANQAPAVRRGVVPLHRVFPEYSRKLQQDNVEGSVVAHLMVSKDGIVKEVRIIKSEPRGVFDREVIRAMMQWKFTPDDNDYIDEAPINFELKKGMR